MPNHRKQTHSNRHNRTGLPGLRIADVGHVNKKNAVEPLWIDGVGSAVMMWRQTAARPFARFLRPTNTSPIAPSAQALGVGTGVGVVGT